MLLNANDLLEIVKIALVLFVSAFSVYLPLLLWLKEKSLALKLTIPVSFSIQIIFGYAFYCFSKISIYPYCYLALITAVNLICIYYLRPKFKIAKPKFKLLPTALGAVLIIAVIYHFFADALSTYAPGTIDTLHHISYLFNDLKTIGYLSFPTYPPGFHILLYPLTHLSTEVPVYRFAGPILGLISLTALILAVKDLFKNKIMAFVLVAIMLTPVFNQLTLQLIGFFPTSLSFIFLSLILTLLLEKKLITWSKVSLAVLIAFAIGLTIPYSTVQLIPSLLALLLYSLFVYKKSNPGFTKGVIIATCGLVLSFTVGFAHVYLQGPILKRTIGFPAIETVTQDQQGVTTRTTYEQGDTWLERKIRPLFNDSPRFETFMHAYVNPMFLTGYDILKLKNIRPFNSIISIGAYAILIAAVVAICFKRRDPAITLLAIMILVFGVSTQTGILEISTYRGRSGFYLLYLTPIFLALLGDKIYKAKIYNYIVALIFLGLLGSVAYAPKYYRDYYPEYYTVATKILNDWSNKTIALATYRTELKNFSKQLSTRPLKQDMALNNCSADKCYLILENKYLVVDPVLSQRAYALDKNGQAFNLLQDKAAKEQKELADQLKNKLPGDTKVYFQNENLTVYELTNR